VEFGLTVVHADHRNRLRVASVHTRQLLRMSTPTGTQPLTFVVSFGSTGAPPQRFSLQPDGSKVVTIGRASKCDIVVKLAGISWSHAELRLMPPADSEKGQAHENRLGLVDLSSNGTGLKVPGGGIERIDKGACTAVPPGSIIIMPMKVKEEPNMDANSLRTCFAIDMVNSEPDATASESEQGCTKPADDMLKLENQVTEQCGNSGLAPPGDPPITCPAVGDALSHLSSERQQSPSELQVSRGPNLVDIGERPMEGEQPLQADCTSQHDESMQQRPSNGCLEQVSHETDSTQLTECRHPLDKVSTVAPRKKSPCPAEATEAEDSREICKKGGPSDLAEQTISEIRAPRPRDAQRMENRGSLCGAPLQNSCREVASQRSRRHASRSRSRRRSHSCGASRRSFHTGGRQLPSPCLRHHASRSRSSSRPRRKGRTRSCNRSCSRDERNNRQDCRSSRCRGSDKEKLQRPPVESRRAEVRGTGPLPKDRESARCEGYGDDAKANGHDRSHERRQRINCRRSRSSSSPRYDRCRGSLAGSKDNSEEEKPSSLKVPSWTRNQTQADRPVFHSRSKAAPPRPEERTRERSRRRQLQSPGRGRSPSKRRSPEARTDNSTKRML